MFWDGLGEIFENEESLSYVYFVLQALHDSKKDKEAFDLIRVLYDLAGMVLPNDVECLENDIDRSEYVKNFIADIDDLL